MQQEPVLKPRFMATLQKRRISKWAAVTHLPSGEGECERQTEGGGEECSMKWNSSVVMLTLLCGLITTLTDWLPAVTEVWRSRRTP